MAVRQNNISIHLGDAYDLVTEFLNQRAEEVTQQYRVQFGDRRYRHKPSAIAKQLLVEAAEGYLERTKRARSQVSRPPPPPHPPRPPSTAGPSAAVHA